MAGSRKLSIEIVGDAKGLSGAFGDAEKAADGFGSKLGGAAKVAGVAMLGIAGGAIAMIPGILETGLSLDALAKKSEVVFGDSLGDVKAWAKENASAMGLTQSEAVGAAAALADLLKPMGFTSEAAADMSTDMLDLSGALSAWSGGTKSATEVSDILTKAMLGETDGLKALGISISAADVSARLALKGQQNLTGAAKEQAEALAVQELIMEKSTDAQDAWASGAMDGVKAQNEQKASMQQLQESLVQALYPALQAIVPIVTEVAIWLGDHLPNAIKATQRWFKEELLPVIEAVFGWLRDNVPPIIQAVAGFVTETLVPAFQSIWAFIRDNVLPVFQTLGTFLADVLVGTFDVVSTTVETLWGWFQTLWDRSEGLRGFYVAGFKLAFDVAVTTIGAVATTVETLWGWFQTLWDRSEGLRGFIAGAFSLGIDVAKGAFDLFSGAIGIAWQAISDAWDIAIQIKDFLIGAFKAGLDVAKGAWDAVSTAVQAVWQVISDVWDIAINVKDFFIGAMKTGLETAKTVWGGFKTVLDGVLGVLKSIYDKAKLVIDVLSGIAGVKDVLVGSPTGQPFPARAKGGPVDPNEPYIVGEEGQELFIPSRAGWILNAKETAEMFAARARGGSYSPMGFDPNVFTPGWSDPNESNGWGPGTVFEDGSQFATGPAGFDPNSPMFVAKDPMVDKYNGGVTVIINVGGSLVQQEDLIRMVGDGLISAVQRGVIPPNSFN